MLSKSEENELSVRIDYLIFVTVLVFSSLLPPSHLLFVMCQEGTAGLYVKIRIILVMTETGES